MNGKKISGKSMRRQRIAANHNRMHKQYAAYCEVLFGRGEEPLPYKKWCHLPGENI